MFDEADICVKENLKRLCSGNPPPGGASVAAVSASLAAGLVAMVCRIAARRKSLAEVAVLNEGTAQRAEELAANLLAMAKKDDEALSALMQAWRMPRGTDAEREARSVAVADASRAALEPPLEIARLGVEGLRLVADAWSSAADVAPSDLATAGELFRAAAMAGLYNAAVNLASLGDAQLSPVKRQIERLHEDLNRVWSPIAIKARNVLDME